MLLLVDSKSEKIEEPSLWHFIDILFYGYNRRVMALAPRCVGNGMKANTVWHKPPALFQSWGHRHVQREKLSCLLNFALCEIYPFVVRFVLSGSWALSRLFPLGIFFQHIWLHSSIRGNPGGEGTGSQNSETSRSCLRSETGVTKLMAFSRNFLACKVDRYFCEHRHAVLEEGFVKQSSVSPSSSHLVFCEQTFGLTAMSTDWVCKGLWNLVSCLLSSCDHRSQASAVGRCLGQSLGVHSVLWIIFVAWLLL